jgi:hypothetical protein
MRYLIPLFLAGCSHAEISATTPVPNAAYVAPPSLTETETQAAATRLCASYHSEPAVPVDHADTLARFECTGRARGGDSFIVEFAGI